VVNSTRRTLQTTFEHPLAPHYTRAGGPWDVPSLDRLFGTEQSSVVDGAVVLGQASLNSAVGSLAGHLRARGVGRGEVVAWQLPNWYEVVLLYWACWRLGAIAFPLHHRLGAHDLAAVFDTVQPALLLSAPGVALRNFGPVVVLRDGTATFEEMLQGPAAPPASVGGHELAAALLTSGSTGQPKAVLHTHRALAYKARLQRQVHDLRAEDVVLMPAPLSHATGLLNGVLLPGTSGMKVVLMETWDPEQALQLIEDERVTFLGGPAVFLTSLVASPGFAPSRVRSLRICSMGGSSMTPTALAELADRLGCVVKRTYGATEAPSMTTMHAGDPAEKGQQTDGRPVGEAEVLVVNPADGTNHPIGEVGEVLVRAPEMFAGYALAAQTEQVITEGGWLRTGDLGYLDHEGWLTIAGRIKELIIRGGENIASAEIEALLESHPDVRHAVAVGYPDHILGERLAAVVVADRGFDLQACRRWFSELGVAKFKTPETIVHVDEIPITATGKADRAGLRAHVATIVAGDTPDP